MSHWTKDKKKGQKKDKIPKFQKSKKLKRTKQNSTAMSYNPYAQAGNMPGSGFQQQQQQPHHQFGTSVPGNVNNMAHNNINNHNINNNQQFNQFFSDPKTQMGFQVGQNAMLAGSQFVGENFGKYIKTNSNDIKYYFKVSNSYVLNKMMLILFPFKNKNWNRSYASGAAGSSDNSAETFAFPCDDPNAPDLYLPLMSIVTYILTIAIISGIKGEFHPQVFGFKSSSTLAYLLLDLLIIKLGLYFLNVSSKFWDLISFIGYKFLPIFLILVIKSVLSFSSILNWALIIYLNFAFGYFILRSLRFNLFGGLNNSAQNLNSKTLKNTNYFLFVYSFVFQSLLIWLLS